MKTIIHKADSRGYADHGWLKSSHSFSFGGYSNSERIHFGALRVLNDDYVEGGHGFGTHPHDNMEIISIPLEGVLEHQDSMGNKGTIEPNEIQVMSAGTGIRHSEYNSSAVDPVKFLQIWLFPHTKDVTPRYDQVKLNPEDRKNRFQQIISPDKTDEGTWIHQEAWFHLADIDAGLALDYTIKVAGNGLYVFVLDGEAVVGGERLDRRDAIGVTDYEVVRVEAKKQSSLLLIEVPMLI